MDGEEILAILSGGTLTIKGEFIWGSNYTFLGEVKNQEDVVPVVYKPCRGQQPLWDFPASTLPHREIAAYLISEALKWELVPPTVFRDDAPFGPGSVQLYIEHDPNYHYDTFATEDRQRLRTVAVFDLVVNNADRKGGHIIFDSKHHLWAIDHGLCFHADEKLRTVIWDFIGEAIDERLLGDLMTLLEKLTTKTKKNHSLEKKLRAHINQTEYKALIRRVEKILDEGVFPPPDPSRRPIPWPRV